MSDFLNTVDVLGDDAAVDGLIDRTIVEFNDNTLESVGDYAFYINTALKAVDMPNAVSIGTKAFYCSSIADFNLPNVTTIGQGAFEGCGALVSINFPKVTTMGGNAFGSCAVLTTAILPSLVSGAWNLFTTCPKLKLLDFTALTRLSGWTFNGTTNPETIILRNENQVVALETHGFRCSGYIYVPRALVEDYKAATNWSNYAEQIRAIEDYTVDGTVSGELDDAKI